VKTWFGIFNFLGLGMIMIMIIIYFKQIETIQTEYDTSRLNKAIDYAGEAAFMESLHAGNIGLSYQSMEYAVLNPAYCLDVFESLICINYGMIDSLENKQYVESCIPSAILACNDGYYLTLLSEVDTAIDNVSGGEYGFKWSFKLPYTVVSASGDKTISVTLGTEDWIMVSAASGVLSIKNGTSYSDAGVQGILSRKIVQRAINTTLTDALARNLDHVGDMRGGVDYDIYLPASTTSSGINNISSPSLIILLQGADFSGQAEVSEAVIAGLKTERKVRVIGFVENGIRRYCYEGQLPTGVSDSAEHFYDSLEEAAKAGYLPSYSYLSRKIAR
jgi:hypothetical protein